MKIGILTYLREYSNLGTNLQGLCTLRALERAFPDSTVELIDYAAWRPVMKPYMSDMSLRSIANDCRRIATYRQFFRDELTFSSRRLIDANPDAAIRFIRDQRYDAIYVGSDTVLEMRGARADRLTAFWLHPSIEAKKSLIAASCHNLTYEALSSAQRAQIQATIDDFSMLGVRDEATRRLLSHFTDAGDERLRQIPDPTFSFTTDYEPIERYIASRGIVFDRPVVCLHLVRNTSWGRTLADRFRAAGYAVASLRPARYADMIFTDLSPFEQLGLYKYFSLIITHRFHDTVFAFKNLTPVIAFPEHRTDVTAFGESRIHTLLKSFGVDIPSGVGDGSSVKAEALFDVHERVIADFAEKRDHIRRVLDDNRLAYERFVKDSIAWAA